MKVLLWACFHPLLLVLTLVNLVTLSSSAILAATVVQTATVVAIPGISSTFTDFGSPSPVLSIAPVMPSFSGTLTAPVVFLPSPTSSPSPSPSISLPNFSSTVPGFLLTSTSTTKSSSSSALSSFLTLTTTLTTTPSPSPGVSTETIQTATPTPGNTSKTPVIAAPVIAGSAVGGVAALGVLFVVLWFLLKKRKNGRKPTKSFNRKKRSRRTTTCGNDLEFGHELQNIPTRIRSHMSNSILQTPKSWYGQTANSRPTNERTIRATSPLSNFGTISTFAPTLPTVASDQTIWAIPTSLTGGNGSRMPFVPPSGPPPRRPRRPSDLTPAERLDLQMKTRIPPTHLPHRVGESPHPPARSPYRNLTPAAQAVLERQQSPKLRKGITKPDGAHWEGLSVKQDYGTYSPYEEDPDNVTELPYPTEEGILYPFKPLNIVKMPSVNNAKPGQHTPPRPPTRGKRFPETEAEKMAKVDDDVEKARLDALASLEGRSPHLTTDKAKRTDLISVHGRPVPIPKGRSYGRSVGFRRVSSTGNLKTPKPQMAGASSSGPLSRQFSRPLGNIDSIYSRYSSGEEFEEFLEGAFEESGLNQRKRKANSTELGNLNDGSLPRSLEKQKYHY